MSSDSSSASHAQRDEILKRTFSGARWMLYMSASALVAGFCTNVLLGRMSPETLGFYSLLMLIVSVVQTFFIFGASNVLVNYLPGLPPDRKPAFIFTYSIIVYIIGILFLAICLLVPSVMQLVFRQELNLPVGTYIIFLAPVLLGQALVWSILQAELEGTVFAVSQNAVSWFYFLSIGLMAMLGFLTALPLTDVHRYIFAGVVLANIVAFVIGAMFVRKEYIAVPAASRGWFLPAGFWKFTLAVYAGTLFNFLIVNAAPVFILRELSLRELGYFRAAAVFAGFVSWVPAVFDKSFYPSFCNLVGRKLPTNEVYTRFARLNAMSSGMVALIIILFTKELLSVFGKNFSDSAYYLLVMLAAGYVISMPFIQVNFALVTAHLKTPFTMVAYAIAAIVGTLLYGVLVPQFGLEGVAIAFIALQLVLLLLSWALTWHFTRSPFPIRPYFITVCVVAIGFAGAYWFGSISIGNTLVKCALLVSFVLFVLTTRLVTRPELKEWLSIVIPKLPFTGLKASR